HRGVPAPGEPPVHALPGKTCLTCSWLHSLKSWSLLKTRGDSDRCRVADREFCSARQQAPLTLGHQDSLQVAAQVRPGRIHIQAMTAAMAAAADPSRKADSPP